MAASALHPTAKERVLNEGDPELLAFSELRETKLRRHDSDHGERALVEIDGAADYFWISAESAAPEILAENYEGRRAAFAVFEKKYAPRQWLFFEHREKLRRND